MKKKRLIVLAMVCSLSLLKSFASIASTGSMEPFQTIINEVSETVSITPNDSGLFVASTERTATTLSVSTNGNGIFKSDDGRFFSQLSTREYMEVGQIEVDISSPEAIASAVEAYGLSQETLNHLTSLMEKNLSDSGKVIKVYVYTANALDARSTRYYIGYNGMRYREELTTSYYQAGPEEVFSGNVSQTNSHINSKIVEVLTYVIGSVADSQSYGAYSLAQLGISLIASSSVPAGAVIEHSAILYTESTEKMTLATEGSSEFLGSVVHKGNFYFEDIIHSEYGVPNQTKMSPKRNYTTPNYNNADRKAYENYQFTGWYETPSDVEHFGVSFSLN